MKVTSWIVSQVLRVGLSVAVGAVIYGINSAYLSPENAYGSAVFGFMFAWYSMR